MALLDPMENSDVTRIASNIITGIGFIGAGIIFRNGLDVQGLTTSATVWVTAAIGMAAGIGNFGLAIMATAITWAALFVLHYVESMLEDLTKTEKYRVGWKAEHGVLDCKEFFEARSYKLKESKLSKSADLVIAEWTLRTSKKTHDELIHKLMTDPRIVLCEH
jgi:putative Mg2+ transporter-C (MgtC) family protein